MKKNLLFVVSIAVFGLLFSTYAFAQDDKLVTAAGSTYVISAKAGGVNYVEGKVSIARQNGTSGLLLKSDSIEIGDKVTTGADGKAEILLNPGSFVRLGGNTEFEFQTTDLDNLKLKLTSGSAIFEVYADNEFKVSLDLPDADLELNKSGVYRVDVLPDGSGKVFVWKGRVLVGEYQAEVKAGKVAIVKGKFAAVTKFDRDAKDEFVVWSDMRAKEASAINKRLRRDALTNSLLNSYNNGGWNLYSTFGLWVFDPFTGRWVFLPFGQSWSSPYGYSYGFNIYYCPLPPRVFTPPVTPTTPPTNPGAMTPEQAQIREERRQTMHTPTFQRFENNQRNETRGGGRVNDSSSDSSDGGSRNNNSRVRSDSDDSRSTRSSSSSSETRTRDTTPDFTPSTRSEPTRSEPSRSEPSRSEPTNSQPVTAPSRSKDN
jgi:hypothetical protein